MKGKYDSKIPVPGERFSYVVTHPDTTFDLHGRKLDPRFSRKEMENLLELKNIIDNL
jgi:hypothetical protein